MVPRVLGSSTLRKCESYPFKSLFRCVRCREFSGGTSNACINVEAETTSKEGDPGFYKSPQHIYDIFLCSPKFFHREHGFLNFSVSWRGISSQADAKSTGGEDDLEDGFSELDTSTAGDVSEDTVNDENDDELISEPELSDENEDDEEREVEMYFLGNEIATAEKKSPRRRSHSSLFKAIVDAPDSSVESALVKWVEEGKEITRPEIASAMLDFRRRKMYFRALQLSEWLEASKKVVFEEKDYACRVDLIAKFRGLQKAENYLQTVPNSFRGELIYCTLLANCVVHNNVKKAELVFNKMKDLKLPITLFACNQLLILYKRLDKRKIADVLLLMEKENVKPSLFTYSLLIDTKGQLNDITGMEQTAETMKDEGIEPDYKIQATLARHYAFAGLKEKAEALLKEIEGDNVEERRYTFPYLLRLYGLLGKADEAARIWKLCASRPRPQEYLGAIEAWGRLGKIKEAEAVFERMAKTRKKLSSEHYGALLKVYASQQMLEKGKDLVKRMADSGCQIGPLTWDILVRLYVGAGEVEKADSILQKAAQQGRIKPLFTTYMTLMGQYAKRGDIHNTEKIFHRMRQSGYTSRPQQFQGLIQAYINAKVPAYGIRERMKADNVFPNKDLASRLAQVDAFRKTPASDLLE